MHKALGLPLRRRSNSVLRQRGSQSCVSQRTSLRVRRERWKGMWQRCRWFVQVRGKFCHPQNPKKSGSAREWQLKTFVLSALWTGYIHTIIFEHNREFLAMCLISICLICEKHKVNYLGLWMGSYAVWTYGARAACIQDNNISFRRGHYRVFRPLRRVEMKDHTKSWPLYSSALFKSSCNLAIVICGWGWAVYSGVWVELPLVLVFYHH